MKIAIEGCAHGDLENIYDTLHILEKKDGIKIDLLICCGDFQSSRNADDLLCMATPQKYQRICTFYKYYSGEKVAPVLTIFIGGNHEASNYLQELPYGGWVAPNIYYMGYAGVVNIAGLRIGGLSGIYKSADYMKGHFEKPPYNEQTKRSVYHVRNLEIFRLKQLSGKIDIMLSHDWPHVAVKYGNVKQLVKIKPHFRDDIANECLGSKPASEVLHSLKPTYWFSAHLHCKYSALIRHEDNCCTKFLALDKCLPKRKFLQVLDVPHKEGAKMELSHDLEWLSILFLTNHLLSVKNYHTYMPGPGSTERYKFTPSNEEKSHVANRFSENLVIPKVFSKTAPAYCPNSPARKFKSPGPVLNPQTVNFCETLGIDDPLTEAAKMDGTQDRLNQSIDLNSTISFIDDTVEESSFDLSQNSTPKKSFILSLPSPKIDDDRLIAAEDLHESGDFIIRADSNQSPKLEASLNIDTSCDSPFAKKFKRRNVEIYRN